jgi:FkbM family methyltransferase
MTDRRATGALAKELRADREAFFDSAREWTPYLSVSTGAGDLFFVRTNDAGVSRRVFSRFGHKDDKILRRAVGFLDDLSVQRPADPVFLEIGANIGTATVSALRRRGFAAAVALEPSPQNHLLLRLNLVANGLEGRVRTIEAAASDQPGELTFDVSHHNSGTHRVPRPGRGPLGDDVITVQAVTLDGLVDQGVVDPARVGLIWVDAAGHEAHVLRGGTSVVQAGIPMVLAIKHGWPETVAGVVRVLSEHYTDFAELRHLHTVHPVTELERVLGSLSTSTDIVVMRR